MSQGCILVPPFSPFYVRPPRSSGRPNKKPRLRRHLAPHSTSHRRRLRVSDAKTCPRTRPCPFPLGQCTALVSPPFASTSLPPLWLYSLSDLHHVPQLPRGVGQSALGNFLDTLALISSSLPRLHSSSYVYPSSASCFFFLFRDYKVPFLRGFFPQIAPPFSYTWCVIFFNLTHISTVSHSLC